MTDPFSTAPPADVPPAPPVPAPDPQADLDADVAEINTVLTDLFNEVRSLQGQIANEPSAPASSLDLSKLDALAVQAKQMDPETGRASTGLTAPGSGTAPEAPTPA